MSSTTWAQLSNNLVYAAMAAYAVALVVLAAEMAFGSRSRVGRQAVAVPAGTALPSADAGSAQPPLDDRGDRLGRIGYSVTVLATVLLGLGVLARGMAAGRAPWGNMYEYALAGSFVASVVYLVVARRYDMRALGLWLVAVVLLLLGLAVAVLYLPVGPLVPALHSYWLVIHVSAATIAAGLFTVAAIASAVHLVASRRADKGRPLRGVPEPDTLDRLAYRVTAFAFPIWTFAVVAGAIWAEASWGRYWNWDPKETWAFITWVVYAAYLHARTTAGWRGRRASWVGLLAYATLIFNFYGVNIFFTGLHSYGGV